MIMTMSYLLARHISYSQCSEGIWQENERNDHDNVEPVGETRAVSVASAYDNVLSKFYLLARHVQSV